MRNKQGRYNKKGDPRKLFPASVLFYRQRCYQCEQCKYSSVHAWCFVKVANSNKLVNSEKTIVEESAQERIPLRRVDPRKIPYFVSVYARVVQQIKHLRQKTPHCSTHSEQNGPQAVPNVFPETPPERTISGVALPRCKKAQQSIKR